MLTCFPSACFLLPFAQLSETLANFLPAQVTVETERKKGPGKPHRQAREITGGEEDNASSFLGNRPTAVNRKTPRALAGRAWPRCARGSGPEVLTPPGAPLISRMRQGRGWHVP